ncbi:MAG: lysophospholipid acyltransferase family protein [Candidatus Puniceispirillaceae bacterium]
MSHHKKPFIIRKFVEFIIWPIEGVIVTILVGMIRLLPVRITSAICGHLLSFIGPMTSFHKRSLHHIALALPTYSEVEKRQIVSDMWMHIGRVIGEYPHIHKMADERFITYHGLEYLPDTPTGCLIIGAHLGNWEMNVLYSMRRDEPYGVIYRPLNNPIANWVLNMRHKRGAVQSFIKGDDAGKGMIRTIKDKNYFYLLVDQKYRQGIDVPFLGHPGKTATGHIKLALKYNIPIFFMHAIRSTGCHFDCYIEPCPIFDDDGKGSDEAIQKNAKIINDKLSEIIRRYPGQYLWPHRRWGKDI